jgi:bifunctional non-homologous end joining protein LigD
VAIKPMLATLIQPRALASGWVYEPKLDGIRVLVKRTGRGIQMLSRLDNRIDATWPDVVAALASALRHDAIVDGELVAIDPATRLSSFNRLQARIHVLRPSAALIARVPVELWLFDCLQVKGEDLRARPWRERRKRLEQLVKPNKVIRVTPVLAGTFRKLYGEACRSGSEGLIGKRTASRYTSGRSGDWVKLKCVNEQEFIVVGWTDPKGTREELGALLLGYYDHDALRYAGKVGTGFDARALRLLKELLRPLGIRRSAVHDPLPVRTDDVHWVRPSLVVEIGFSEWTRDGRLRHPRYLGLREDKAASDVVREDPRAP